MKRIFISLLFIGASTTSFAEELKPKCLITESKAIAFMCSSKTTHGSGVGRIEVYGEEGDLITVETLIWHVVIPRKGCVKVESFVFDEKPIWCNFIP